MRSALPVAFGATLLLASAEAASDSASQPAPKAIVQRRLLAEDELRRARAFEERGDTPLALTAYTVALRIDPTLGPAYLGLARLRERLRDFREAELLYTHALFVREARGAALFGRALLRRADGRTREAFSDLEQSVELEPDSRALTTLAGWYVESRNWPAALSVWRRLARVHREAGDVTKLRDAELSIAALRLLAAEADPVTATDSEKGWVRRSLAHIARRGQAPRDAR
jgi:tetratricopeptide (TPR) repeat protein